jgi:hypothetical protein
VLPCLLQKASREVLYAWSLCVSVHVDKVLQSLQSRYDYLPREGMQAQSQSSGQLPSSCSPACNNACKAVLAAIFVLKNSEEDIVGINMSDECYKPLGRLFVGTVSAHIKRQKISLEGGRVLLRDLEEYIHVKKPLGTIGSFLNTCGYDR